jgi:CheY-like chemotaxis protein
VSDEDLQFVSEDDGGRDLATPVGRCWRILLVDDDEDVHVATRYALKSAVILGRSLEFLHASSAAEARVLLQTETNIAVAFVDVVMETKDAGLLLVKYIREEAGLLDTRIILRTG